MERLGTNLNEIDTTDCENSLESLQVICGDLITTIEQFKYESFPLQQIAVKLYEKDPSKLTSVDEAIPAVSTSSDLSDDEEEDSNLAEIKEEPMEVVPNMSLAPPPEPEHSTDSDTVSVMLFFWLHQELKNPLFLGWHKFNQKTQYNNSDSDLEDVLRVLSHSYLSLIC